MNAVVKPEDIIANSVHLSRLSGKWFIKNILNQLDACDPWQIEVVEAVLDVWRKLNGHPTVVNHKGLNRITIVSCHGTGKTHLLALILHVWNYCFYGLVVGTAPKQDQIKTRFMPRYRQIKKAANSEYQKLQSVDTLKISILGDPDWGYIGETASEPENMAGFHDTPQLILVDEASARSLDPMFPVIEGALTTMGSVLVEIGNPTRTQGEFWASHNKRGTKELYYRVHVKPTDSRYVSPQWVKDMKKKYGKESSVFKIRCLGEFVDMEENQLVAMSWIEDARREWSGDGSIRKIRITVDVADGGEDETIITVAYIYETFTVLYRMYRYSFAQGECARLVAKAAHEVAQSVNYKANNTDDVVIDVIGVGAGAPGCLFDLGTEEAPYNIVPYRSGSTENVNQKKWRNQRVRSYISMRDDFRDGRLIIDPDFCDAEDWEDYIAQMCTIRTKPGLERNEDLESKQEMKRSGIKSPDMPDGSSMVYATQTPVTNHSHALPMLVGQMESNKYDS